MFSVDSSGRQIIRNFSLRQRLHLLLELLYGERDERMRQEINKALDFASNYDNIFRQLGSSYDVGSCRVFRRLY